MDLQMPGMRGIDAAQPVCRTPPDTVVLVLTMFDEDDTVFAAMAAGAAGYQIVGGGDGDVG
jgi:DNA-binding NarL/FixJ family response regulator